MTLQEYFQHEYENGTIDFSLRASVWEGAVTIYIHPIGKDGTTTPSLIVEGNTVRLAPGCYSPEWPK